MNLKFKITASYFGSQEILTAAHMPLGKSPFFRSQSSYQCLSVKTLKTEASVRMGLKAVFMLKSWQEWKKRGEQRVESSFAVFLNAINADTETL